MDDKPIVESNALIRNLGNLPKIFVSNYWANTPYGKGVFLYRPLVISSFAIDYAIWSHNPFGFHLTNIILNDLNSVLLFLILVSFFKSLPSTYYLLSALLFSFHPVHTEAVNMIVGRTELLATFFYLLTLWLYIKNKYFGCLITFFLALLSKEMAITLPLVLFSSEFIFKKKCEKKHYIGFLIVIAIYFIIRTTVLGGLVSAHQTGILSQQNFPQRIFIVFQVLGHYLKLLFWPYPLTPDYSDFPLGNSLFKLDVFIPLILIVVLLFIAYRFKDKQKIISFSIIWFFITILPVSNIISIGTLIGERFLYLPSISLSILAIWIYPKFRNFGNTVLLVLGSVILIIFGMITFSRNYDWKDNFSLWNVVLKYQPDNVRANYNLGEYYESLKENDKALQHYEKSVEYYPQANWHPDRNSILMVKEKISNIYYGLCLKCYKDKDYKKSLEYCLKAISHNESKVESYVMLGNNYFQLNDIAKALESYKKALQINPDQFEAKENYKRIKNLGQ
ncbi:MAG: tetratricopeptide repeat protein [Candidatus Firestonebacteria bacterium]